MKTVAIISDGDFTDTEKMMQSIEHLVSVGSWPEECEILTSNAPGAETVMMPIMREVGFTVTEVPDVSVADIMVTFTSKREGRAHDLLMAHWNAAKWVYAFHVAGA